jgi:deoxyribodipyrimidine photo-lyase
LNTLPGWTESADQLLQAAVSDETHKRSNFPYTQAHCRGGETSGLSHLRSYLTPPWPDRYKQTRNALQGQHTSSHWSPWLATGALSARTIWAALHGYETQYGANDGTYWLWFELLWRDNFRLLHLQHGRQLYAARGLSHLPKPSHFPKDFQRWCSGNTGEPIVDAGMRELAATGFPSNRMRQIVASFLVHDLACDWRAGAAWFESQLVDFDVCSNQGNWLYVSGRGTDPRAGRRFNPAKQTQDHDPQGRFQKAWLSA